MQRARQRLTHLRQNKRESVSSYLNSVDAVASEAARGQPPEVLEYHLLTDFVNGLLPRIRMLVRREAPTDASKAQELALLFEAFWEEEEAWREAATGLAPPARPATNPDARRRVQTCYRYGRQGHIARECGATDGAPRVLMLASRRAPEYGLLVQTFSGAEDVPFGEWSKEFEAALAINPTALAAETKLAFLRAHLNGMARAAFEQWAQESRPGDRDSSERLACACTPCARARHKSQLNNLFISMKVANQNVPWKVRVKSALSGMARLQATYRIDAVSTLLVDVAG